MQSGQPTPQNPIPGPVHYPGQQLPDLPQKDAAPGSSQSVSLQPLSSNHLLQATGNQQQIPWRGLAQRKIQLSEAVKPNLVQAPDEDSGIESNSSTPNSVSAATPVSSFTTTEPVLTVKLSCHRKLQELLPEKTGVLPKAVEITFSELQQKEWLNQYFSPQDQSWLEVKYIQGGELHDWRPWEKCPLDPSQPVYVVLRPGKPLYNSDPTQLPKLSTGHSYRLLHSQELDSVTAQLNSIYQGQRPAGVIYFPSALDPRLNQDDPFPGLHVRLLPDLNGSGVTAVLARKDDLKGSIRVERLEQLVQKERQQAQTDIARGTPPYIALLRSRIRNMEKRGEQESIHPDSIKEEIKAARKQLSNYNQAISTNPSTQAEKRIRESAITKRVKERFNSPSVTKEHLQSLDLRSRSDNTSPPDPLLLSTQQAIDEYQKQLGRLIPADQNDAEAVVKQLLRTAEDLQKQLYLVAHKNRDNMLRTELDVLMDKISELEGDKLLLFQVLDSPALSSIAEKLSWQQAIEFRRVGYRLDDELTVPGPWVDEGIDPDQPPRALATGGENTVYLLTYKTGEGPVRRVFKPESAEEKTAWRAVISDGMFHDYEHPNLTARNLATGEIAHQLGMSVMPEMSFCEHNHQIGLSMELAPGHEVNTLVKTPSSDRLMTLGYHQMIAGRAVPAIRSRVLAGLADLELLDAICAQPDRHPSNLFIDYKTGRVTGIDNDICLYPFSDIIAPSADEYYEFWSKGCRVGYPRLMDRGTYKRLMSLNVETVCSTLPPCFDQRVRDSLKQRIWLLQQHGQALEVSGRIVDNWQTWRHPHTRQSAQSFLLSAGEKVAEYDNTMLAAASGPILSAARAKQRKSEPLSPQEQQALHNYTLGTQLLRNDQTNAAYSVYPSYFSMTV